MLLVIDGITCNSGPQQQRKCKIHGHSSNEGMLQCQYLGNDDSRNFTVAADAPGQSHMSSSRAERVIANVSLDVNASITCVANDTWNGRPRFSFKIVCPVEWQILLRVSPIDIDDGIVVKAFDDEEEKEEKEDGISSENSQSNYPIFLLSKNNFLEIMAIYPNAVMQDKTFMLSARAAKVIEQINPDQSDCEVNPASRGNDRKKLGISCLTNSSYVYDIALISFDDGKNDRLFTVICWFDVSHPPSSMIASCNRTSSTLQVEFTVPMDVDTSEINLGTIFFLRYAPDPLVGSRSVNPMATFTTTRQSQPTTVNHTTTIKTIRPLQPTFATPMTRAVKSNKTSQRTVVKSSTVSIVVPTVVVLVAVFLIVALAATIWCKKRNKQASEGDGTIALNIRSTVNQNEGTVVYNEIGEQDYNTLYGGKERDNYHEYNVPDRPQGKTSVDRTTASGSGPYQELLQDGTRALAAVNMSPGVTGPKHGVADDLHAYQDLRQDDRSVSGSHPNGEMPNQLPSKDTPATENGYHALKTATPEYATLEPSPEYATLEQNDQSVKGTSDVSGPPSDKEYDTLQRSINTVGQPPSAGYGTLMPMNEADAD